MLTYTNFLELLESKNILLWDFQKRISYIRLINLELPQYGGGTYNKIDTIDNFKFTKIILFLLQNNIESAKKLLN